MKKLLFVLFSFLILSGCSGLEGNKSKTAKCVCNNGYSGRLVTPPDTAEIFAPGVISVNGRIECAIGFMPDYEECYVCIREEDWSKSQVFRSQYIDSKWSEPSLASFSDDQSIGAWPSSDGKRIYFVSTRPKFPPSNIWMCKRQGDGWSDPVKMADPISSPDNEWSCCEGGKDTIYTCSWRKEGSGGCDIWCIKNAGKESQTAENIKVLNSGENDCNPVISPDGKYLMFCSKRPDSFGKWDIYISMRGPDGNWQEPHNLGSLVNTAEDEGGPVFSPDGQAIFFTRTNGDDDCDIYWISLKTVLTGLND